MPCPHSAKRGLFFTDFLLRRLPLPQTSLQRKRGFWPRNLLKGQGKRKTLNHQFRSPTLLNPFSACAPSKGEADIPNVGFCAPFSYIFLGKLTKGQPNLVNSLRVGGWGSEIGREKRTSKKWSGNLLKRSPALISGVSSFLKGMPSGALVSGPSPLRLL